MRPDAASLRVNPQSVPAAAVRVTLHLYTTSLRALHVRPTHNARLTSPPLLLLLPLLHKCDVHNEQEGGGAGDLMEGSTLEGVTMESRQRLWGGMGGGHIA